MMGEQVIVSTAWVKSAGSFISKVFVCGVTGMSTNVFRSYYDGALISSNKGLIHVLH